MTSLRYQPSVDGAWLLVARSGRALLVERSAAEARTGALLDALSAPGAAAAVLETLMADGLGSMPAFGLVEPIGAGARILVRGAVQVSGDGTTLSGADYSTWAERVLDDVGELSLRASAAAGEATLPLGDGAVPADGAVLRLAKSGDGGPQRIEHEQEPASAPSPIQESPARPVEPAPGVAPPPAPIEAPPVIPIPAPPVPAARVSAPPEQTMVEFTVSDIGSGYEHLFEETIVRPIEEAAVRESDGAQPTEPDGEPAGPPAALGEHDGHTVLSGDLQKLRARAAEKSGAAPSAAPGVRLDFSTGIAEPLTGTVIVGRSPSSGRVSADRVPRLIAIPDDPDLSRNHVQIAVEGDSVVVTDLDSRNGTHIVLPGKAPQRLRGGEPTTVIVGTIIDLGGGLTISVVDEGGER